MYFSVTYPNLKLLMNEIKIFFFLLSLNGKYATDMEMQSGKCPITGYICNLEI